MIGVGVGLLTSWQSRSTRDQAARQAPYAAAHHLMARIHQLASSGNLGLNSATLAMELDTAMRGGYRWRPLDRVRSGAGPHAPSAQRGEDVERLAQEIEISGL